MANLDLISRMSGNIGVLSWVSCTSQRSTLQACRAASLLLPCCRRRDADPKTTSLMKMEMEMMLAALAKSATDQKRYRWAHYKHGTVVMLVDFAHG
jgi:hypothetical protein